MPWKECHVTAERTQEEQRPLRRLLAFNDSHDRVTYRNNVGELIAPIRVAPWVLRCEESPSCCVARNDLVLDSRLQREPALLQRGEKPGRLVHRPPRHSFRRHAVVLTAAHAARCTAAHAFSPLPKPLDASIGLRSK